MHEQKQQLMQFWKSQCHFDERVLQAFSQVNREDFVPERLRHASYEDQPLPILRGKTISQPTTVMVMTTALDAHPEHTVFEIGTGSGYQAAILSQLAKKVISTEIIPELIPYAKENLKNAGITNVEIHEEDGSEGMDNIAPFDRIIITAACKEFPPVLIEQLKDGGIIVGPVGSRDQQEMVKGTKKDGKLDLEFLGPFIFTPMYGKHGFEV